MTISRCILLICLKCVGQSLLIGLREFFQYFVKRQAPTNYLSTENNEGFITWVSESRLSTNGKWKTSTSFRKPHRTRALKIERMEYEWIMACLAGEDKWSKGKSRDLLGNENVKYLKVKDRFYGDSCKFYKTGYSWMYQWKVFIKKTLFGK